MKVPSVVLTEDIPAIYLSMSLYILLCGMNLGIDHQT